MAKESKERILNYTFKSHRPYKHQVGALKKALDLDKATALFMEPGTGKTRVAIDFTGINHLEGKINKVLVICPNVAIEVWVDQIAEYLPSMIERQVIPLSSDNIGSVNRRKEVLNGNRKVNCLTYCIVNYDVIANQQRLTDEGKVQVVKRMKDAILKWRPDMVILDESHYIKHATSARTRAILSIGARSKYRMALSGTPITNSPMDIFSQFKFLDPSIFGTRWVPFKHRYGVYGGFGGFKLLKYKHLDEMSTLAHKIAFEATKDDMDLPGASEPQLIKIPMSAKTKAIYDKMEKEMIVQVDELGNKATAAITLTKVIRLRQITGGFVRVDGRDIPIGDHEKLDALKELLTDYVKEAGYKVVIFATFKWEQQAIMDLCGKLGIQAIRDTGGKEARKRFQQDPKCKVFVASLSRTGIAVNELVAAHIGIFYSLDHFSDHFTQAKDRLHRPGQTHHVTYQVLALKGTVDVDIFKALTTNKEIADYVTYRIKRRGGRI